MGLANNLPATAALVGAGLAGMFTSLRYFSDQSAKITDFRKAWIETLRSGVAEFVANTHAIVGRVAIRTRHSRNGSAQHSGEFSELSGTAEAATAAVSTAARPNFDEAFESLLLPYWTALRLAHNKSILHLNPREHLAYLGAETALAAYYVHAGQDAKADTVNIFLRACLDDAYSRLAEEKELQPGQRGKAANTTPVQPVLLPAFPGRTTAAPQDPHKHHLDGTAGKPVYPADMKAADALLLAMFATRQLLHGTYDTLVERVADIEYGIRVVDTAAAIVIKSVWAEIKNGEPGYRITAWSSLVVSLLVVAAVSIALLMSPESSSSKSLKMNCRGQPTSPLLAPAGSYLSCEASSPG
jgi:hypothetical protein